MSDPTPGPEARPATAGTAGEDLPATADRPPATAPVPEGRSWGIDPRRSNRWAVRAVLALERAPSAQTRVGRRLRRGARAAGSLLLGSEVQTRAIGEDLYLPHPFGIVIHGRATIGDRCTIYQHVTIGEDNVRPGVPLIGDDVVVGAGAAILGPVRIGDGARIGANAVVLADVPPGAVAVGVPARLVG